jgi:hypothetical protein
VANMTNTNSNVSISSSNNKNNKFIKKDNDSNELLLKAQMAETEQRAKIVEMRLDYAEKLIQEKERMICILLNQNGK